MKRLCAGIYIRKAPLSLKRLAELRMFSAMAKALEVGGKVVQPDRVTPVRAPAPITSGCGAKRATAASASAGGQLAGESALTAERGLSAAKRKAADDHMNVVRRLAKKPAVAESDSQEWKEGVAAMETNLVSSLAASTGGQYSYWWGKFETFCSLNKREAM